MKNWKRILELTFLVALFYVCLFVLPALAVRVGDDEDDQDGTEIFVLDELHYDVQNIELSYTLMTNCMRSEHETVLDYELDRTGRGITGMRVIVMDYAPVRECSGRKREVTVSSRIDFETWFNDVTSEIERQGYRFDPEFVLRMPALRSPVPGTGEYSGDDMSGDPGNTPAPLPSKVKVTVVEYSPAYQCTLYKSDGSSDDGFTGTGSSIEEARRSAAASCQRTNNPNCLIFSNDPAHTTCDIAFMATENIREYDANNLPEGSKIESWACTLNKNDGSRKDGFTGSGATESDARANAAAMCRATKHPKCDAFALDNSHTSCAAAMRYEAPKPAYAWVCSLYKNDGSRKDGFSGSGQTELEARRDAASLCRSTSNPYCDQFSMDPAHTTCAVEFEQQ